MPATPPDIGQPTREARTGHEDQRGNKWWTLVAVCLGTFMLLLPAPARQVAGTITRAAFTTGLDRILLVAAIIAFVAGVVSLAAIRSRDFARAAPGGQEDPGK
jgi:hypothetical protein